MQPRITPSLPTGPGSTTYQRIVSGPGGVDPYAAAISDVYQDLFEEGSYTGKGIYDVDAFEAALAGKAPENTLLSHDLFEGLFARAGLLTDVDLFEEFPSNYEVAARRQHRWVRGDWQLLPWILGYARNAAGRKTRTRIPAHGRWKMLDNLRRSLTAPSSFLLAVVAWTLPSVSAPLWTGLFVGSVAVPACHPGARRPDPAAAGDLQTQPPARGGRRRLRGSFPDLPGRHHAGAPGLAHGRCRAAHARAALCHAPEPARVGSGRAGGVRGRSEAPLLLPEPSLWRRPRPLGGPARGRVPAGRLGGGDAVHSAVDAVAGHRLADEPAAEARGSTAARRGRDALPSSACAPHLALLRDVRDGRRECPAAGQLSGRPRAGHRASHLADQPGSLPAEHDRRP